MSSSMFSRRSLFRLIGYGSAALTGAALPRSALAGVEPQAPGAPPTVSFNAKTGAMTVTYKGHTYYNGESTFAFHAYKADGSVESRTPDSWDDKTKTWTFDYPWGSVTLRAEVSGRKIIFTQQLHNTSADNIAGFVSRLTGLTLPAAVAESLVAVNDIDPPVAVLEDTQGVTIYLYSADYANRTKMQITSVSGTLYRPVFGNVISTAPLRSSGQKFSTPTPAGQSSPAYTFVLSWDEPPPETLYDGWRAKFPFKLRWTDNRAIMRHIGLDSAKPTEKNPNGWNWGFRSDAVDVTTPEGLADLRTRMLAHCEGRKARMQEVGPSGALGIVFWSIEGNRYPKRAYLGCPELTYELCPEWLYETDGVPLIQEVLNVYKNAGFRVGTTLRRQSRTYDPNTRSLSVGKVPFTDQEEADLYISKINFCIREFGASMFYIDSIRAFNSGPVLEMVHEEFGDSVLLLPEYSSIRGYATSMQHRGGRGPDPGLLPSLEILRAYPEARRYTAIRQWKSDPALIARYAEAVRRGNGVMFGGHFGGEPGFIAAKQIYAAAAKSP